MEGVNFNEMLSGSEEKDLKMVEVGQVGLQFLKEMVQILLERG